MNSELISIIVPVYNVEKYLERCVYSIINQTYKNIEIILIDDGSTDNCNIICDRFKMEDNRVKVIHKSNEGLSSSRNKGIEITSGNIICFIDSDDYIESNMIEILKNNMDKYNSDISICNFYYEKNERKTTIINKNNDLEFCSIGKEKYNNIINEYGKITEYVWNKLYKKTLFKKIRFPKGKIFEDSNIICDILGKAKRVSYIMNPLYNYVYRTDSIVNTFNINHFDEIDSFNKKIAFFEKKDYYDISLDEKRRKMNTLITNLSKMKRYHIKNKKVFNKYYKELVDTNKEVKWKNATWKNKMFKILRRPTISILAFGLRARDLIRR